jgi:hypothetical protein
VDDKQYWVFENKEEKREFEGSFSLKLTNLRDDEDKSEVVWNL